ncbi:MAG: hypothetical protein AAGI71_11680 [Bacteroidota bacterium]
MIDSRHLDALERSFRATMNGPLLNLEIGIGSVRFTTPVAPVGSSLDHLSDGLREALTVAGASVITGPAPSLTSFTLALQDPRPTDAITIRAQVAAMQTDRVVVVAEAVDVRGQLLATAKGVLGGPADSSADGDPSGTERRAGPAPATTAAKVWRTQFGSLFLN